MSAPEQSRIPDYLVFTIGHSTRPFETLIAILKSHRIDRLADIRTIPRSRRNPQFNIENLEAGVPAAGIAYEHRKGLGGLRRPREDSPNTSWQHEGFRGYADYMETPEFESELASLIAAIENGRLAIMCAEAAPSRCHRSLVADALTVRGNRVEHIIEIGKCEAHGLTPFARVLGTRVSYPRAQGSLFSGAEPTASVRRRT